MIQLIPASIIIQQLQKKKKKRINGNTINGNKPVPWRNHTRIQLAQIFRMQLELGIRRPCATAVLPRYLYIRVGLAASKKRLPRCQNCASLQEKEMRENKSERENRKSA